MLILLPHQNTPERDIWEEKDGVVLWNNLWDIVY